MNSSSEELGYLKGKVEGIETRMEDNVTHMDGKFDDLMSAVTDHACETRAASNAMAEAMVKLREDTEVRNVHQDTRLEILEKDVIKARGIIKGVKITAGVIVLLVTLNFGDLFKFAKGLI